MPSLKNRAKTLYEKYFGSDWINSIPAEWRAGLRYFIDKTQGVPNDTDPDPITGDTVSSQVTTNRTNELELQTTRLDADLLTGAVEHGQDLDRRLGLITPFTRHLSLDDAEVGDINKKIDPLNPKLSVVEEFDFTAIIAFAATFLLELPGQVSLDLPVELISLTASMEKAAGAGSYEETGSGFAVEPGGWRLSIPGRGEGSASIIPVVIPVFKHRNGRNVPTTRYVFLLPIPVTTADIIAALATFGVTVSAWPKFSPQPATLKLLGQEMTLQANTSAQEEDSLSGDVGEGYSESSGSGASYRKGQIVREKELPPTIHGTINVGGTTSDSQAASATASSTTGTISASIGVEDSVAASVSPTTLATTGNTTSVPTTGKYLLPADAEPYLPGYALIHAEVVDFANVG